MKKLLLLLVFMVSFSMNAQENTTVVEGITETERIVDKYGEKLAQGFSTFMETATPMAQEGFKVVVKLQYAKGIAYLLIPLFAIICWFIFFNKYKQVLINQKEQSKDDWINADQGTPTFVFLFISIVLSIASPFTLYSGITHILAPEWFAIKEISTLF